MKKILFLLLVLLIVGLYADDGELIRIFPAGNASDICTGFAKPVSLKAETYPTEGTMTWNEQELIIQIKAFLAPGKRPQLPPSTGAVEVAGGLFQGDSLEFFLQPDLQNSTYYHFAIGPTGRQYTAKMRNASWPHKGTSTITRTETAMENSWTATWRLPWSDFGVKPTENQLIKINLCRNHRVGTKIESFCFARLLTPTFHSPDTWRTAQLVRKADRPRRLITVEPKKNLLLNPEFDEVQNNKVTGWNLRTGAERVENMALSGEWIIRCSGKAYAALDQIPQLTPGNEYTLQIRARRIGPASQLGCILMWLRDDGKWIEKSIAWKVPLTEDYREYRYSFICPPNPGRLIFYKLGGDLTDGVDYAGIHLYEGKSDPFEIRGFGFFRAGMKIPAPGTGPIRPNNPYGKSSKKLRALAIVNTLRYCSDVVELFQGLNAHCDRMAVTGNSWDFTPDVYFSDSDPRQVMDNITRNQYDLYIVSYSNTRRLGPELMRVLKANVEKGAGIWFCRDHEQPLFGLQEPAKGHNCVPFGKGKILRTQCSEEVQFTNPPPSCETERLQTLAYAASLLYRTAGYPALVTSQQWTAAPGNYLFQAPGNIPYRYEIRDRQGNLVTQGKGTTTQGQNTITPAPLVCSGKHFMNLYLLDAQGNTVDFVPSVVYNAGPGIKVIPAQESFSGRGNAQFNLILRKLPPGAILRWQLLDWSGRILEQQELPANKEMALSVPLAYVETNYAELRLFLIANQQEKAFTRCTVLVRDRDRARQTSDFTATNWNASFAPRHYAAQMENIGMDHGIRPEGGIECKLAAGLGCGGQDRGTHAMGPRKQPINGVRQPSLFDPAVWNPIEERCRRLDKSEYKYGVTFAGIIDEAGLSSRMWQADAQEVDAHPLNVAAYRTAMEKRFGTIARFNQICGTNYSNFSQLQPVTTSQIRARKNFAEFILWRAFNTDQWIGKIHRLREIMNETDPELPLCLYNSFGPRALDGSDYWKLLTKAGIDFSLEYTNLVRPGRDMPFYDFDEVYRSFRPDMRVWGFIGYVWNHDLANYQPWWLALHRYGGLGYFSMTATDAGTLLALPSCELTQEGVELQRGLLDSGLLSGFGKLFLDYPWAKNNIAILWSHDSLMTSWCLSTEKGCDTLDANSPYSHWHLSRHCLRYLLEDLLYQYDYVAPENLEQALQGRKLLILPYAIALSDQNIQTIKRFIAQGGKVIADTMPGIYTELGVPRAISPLEEFKNSPNFQLTGFAFNDKDDTCREKLFELLLKDNVYPVVASPAVPRLKGREAMHFVRNNLHIFAILRNHDRASDQESQEFSFPVTGHIYELRTGRYHGFGNEVTATIAPSETALFGVYPYQIKNLSVTLPTSVSAGSTLPIRISVLTSQGKAGQHLFHVALVQPDGKCRRRIFTRNLTAPGGKASLDFRLAFNDPKGIWTLQVTDILSGQKVEKTFSLR